MPVCSKSPILLLLLLVTLTSCEITNQPKDEPKEPKTLEQIGIALGFSKERIRQIENVALQKLRRVENVDCLKSYLDAS